MILDMKENYIPCNIALDISKAYIFNTNILQLVYYINKTPF